MILELFTLFVAAPIAFGMAGYAFAMVGHSYAKRVQNHSRVRQQDGRYRQIVTINQGHIANGSIKEPTACMIALALRDVGIGGLLVGAGGITTHDGRVIMMPKTISKQIDRFDRNLTVKPFAFEIVRRGNSLLAVNETTDTKMQVSNDGVYWFTIDEGSEVYR